MAIWEQIVRLVEAMPENLRLPTLVMGYTGARIGEVLGLTPTALSEDDNILTLSGSYTRKHGGQKGSLKHRRDGEDRPVPLPDFLRDAIKSHIKDYGIKEDGYLFPGTRAKVINDDAYRKHFKAASRRSDYPPTSAPTT
ncbi:tyrosine-type recombinase/integrase [Streptosporangium sp. NBC_01495]|nr:MULTISPECIES: tyrosine-type recombinase/integrase [unclassified Streptosporangium]